MPHARARALLQLSVDFVELAVHPAAQVRTRTHTRTRATDSRGVSRFGGASSREMTLANGKRLIQQFAQVMRLGNDHVEVANRFFQQAVQRSFIQGSVCVCVCVCVLCVCVCVCVCVRV